MIPLRIVCTGSRYKSHGCTYDVSPPIPSLPHTQGFNPSLPGFCQQPDPRPAATVCPGAAQ